MPQIIGSSVRVVDTGLISIDELAGNVATKNDRISIALVKISAPTDEPWLTLHYDEWICVTKGRMVLLMADGAEKLEVLSGQTVFIKSGTRFRPTFPEAGTEYVPVCLPAFRPDRCIREDGPDSEVAAKLRKLHHQTASTEEESPEVLYHMCQKSLWEKAKEENTAYFPPTFEKDGFTHATAVPSRLLDTANHFYQDCKGEWVCLRFKRSALRRAGIITVDEKAMPVGNKAVNESHAGWICPHVMGGIPPSVVDMESPMHRDGPKFTAIAGLTETPRRLFKLATAEEVASFKECGRVLSSLDKADGFVHLGDRSAVPVVAGLFFKGCPDLQLLEIDAEKLAGPSKWFVGPFGEEAPDAEARNGSASAIHYMLPNGCVHVYGEAGVPMSAVIRSEHVPLADGDSHAIPSWL